MCFQMWRYSLFFLLACCLIFPQKAWSQESPSIKVRKESRLAKVVLDNSAYKLIVIDRYGNPTEARLMHYLLHVKTKRETRVFEGHTNALSPEMVNYLNGLGSATKIFFTEIQAEEEGGHLSALPDLIETWFPDCSNCEKKRNRK